MDNTIQLIGMSRSGHKPVVIGTGLVALDVVIPNGLDADPYLCAGGTCGNVLTALAYMGWSSYPVARLRADGASRRVSADLRHWGVHLDFATFGDDGSTPVIVQHIRNKATGEPTHSFSRKCPSCGAVLPWYKAVRATDVSTLTPKLPTHDVFFFDRTSRGALSLAEHARQQGAVVVFEPSASSEPHLLTKALELSHIVKVSSDRLAGNEAVLMTTKPTIIIETNGSQGLHFRHTDSKTARAKWHKMEPIQVESLKDTAGAGDWCTAGIIHVLGTTGAQGLAKLTTAKVEQAIRVGQAMASWTCSFDGPRGGMYVCNRNAFQKSIQSLLNGQSQTSTAASHAAQKKQTRGTFACESCKSPVPQAQKRLAD